MKKFKTFMSEHPSYDAPMNPAMGAQQGHGSGGFGDPMVIKKINALMGKLTAKESFADGELVISKIRDSLSKVGLTFDVVPAMSEDSGNFSMPLALWGGRFGKLPDTPIDEFVNDDGLQDQVEGGLSLEISYEMTEDNCYRIHAEIK